MKQTIKNLSSKKQWTVILLFSIALFILLGTAIYKTNTLQERSTKDQASFSSMTEYLEELDKAIVSSQENLSGINLFNVETKDSLTGISSTLETLEQLTKSLESSLEQYTLVSQKNQVKIEQSFNSLGSYQQLLESQIIDSRKLITEILSSMASSDSQYHAETMEKILSLQTCLEKTRDTMESYYKDIMSQSEALKKDMENQSLERSEELAACKEELLTVLLDTGTNLQTALEDHSLTLQITLQENYLSLMDQMDTLNTNATDQITVLNDNLFNQYDINHNQTLDALNNMEQNNESSFTSISNGMTNQFLSLNTNVMDQLAVLSNNLNNQYSSLTTTINTSDTGLREYVENSMGLLNQQLQQVFSYVSSGKQKLASALLTKGVSCNEDATFSEIYQAILDIPQQLLIGVQQLPGQISYDYHYHQDADGNLPHTEQLQINGGCYTTPVHHVHQGKATDGGGCYTTPVYHSHTDSCYSEGNHNENCPNHTEYHSYDCGTVHDWNGDGHGCDGFTAWDCGGHKYLSCNKGSGIIGYSLGCGKSGSTIDAYGVGCRLTDGQIIAAHIVYDTAALTAPLSALPPDTGKNLLQVEKPQFESPIADNNETPEPPSVSGNEMMIERSSEP